MQQVIQMASEIYMIVLCLLAGPADQSSIRIDQVGTRGLMSTTLAERTDKGFAVYDQRGGQRVPFVTLLRQEGKPGVFVAKGPNGQEEVIDLSAELVNLQASTSRRQGKQVVQTKGGSEVQIARSGLVTYLTEARADRTYVVHSDQPRTETAGRGGPAAGQQEVKVYKLKYAQAPHVGTIVQGILGDAGKAVVDERTSSIIVTTSADLQARVTRLIAELDMPAPGAEAGKQPQPTDTKGQPQSSLSPAEKPTSANRPELQRR